MTLLRLHHLWIAYVVYLCVICNSKIFRSFIFKLCIMIVNTLKMCIGDAGPEQSLVLLDLNLSTINGIVSSKIYDKRDDYNFEIVNFLFLDGDLPRSPSYGVYISQLIRFARVCSNVDDFNNRNLFLTAKLLKQGYIYLIKSKSIF